MEARSIKGQGEAPRLRKYLGRGGKKGEKFWKVSEGKCARKERGEENKGGKERAQGEGEASFPFVSSKF